MIIAYNAKSVAWYIINYCNSRNVGMSNLKLQKILYFVQAQFLVLTPNHSPCFSDTIEAWDFGPVVPSVYHSYKIYGGTIIPVNYNDPLIPFYQRISAPDNELVNDIVDRTKYYSNSTLTEIVHNQDPWRNAYTLRKHDNHNKISNESIYKYFKN